MSNRLYAGTRKGFFTIERSGSGWKIARASFVGMHVPMLLADPRDGSIYAALEHGHFGTKLHRSTDGGATFEETGVPTYPPAEGPPVINPMNNKPFPQKLEKIWALEPGHRSEPGVLWCGTIPGGLFRSGDSGKTWELNRSLWDNPGRKEWFGGGAEWPGIHSICVDPHDGKKVMLGVSCGGVWATRDGGASWNCKADGMFAAYMPPEQAGNPNIQDVHRLAQCPASPDALWAQHHNGVFRSTDGAASWHEVKDVSPSVFGFAVAVHPREPNTAWFVPAIKDELRIPVDGKVVVSRTRDGGKSFDVLRKGLPQEHAYDLVFRHGLDVDESGNRVVFGSTTGSLWISEDQGDSWQAISQHLPPVYCVRFEKP
jgi:hypothetical protein